MHECARKSLMSNRTTPTSLLFAVSALAYTFLGWRSIFYFALTPNWHLIFLFSLYPPPCSYAFKSKYVCLDKLRTIDNSINILYRMYDLYDWWKWKCIPISFRYTYDMNVYWVDNMSLSLLLLSLSSSPGEGGGRGEKGEQEQDRHTKIVVIMTEN